MLPIWQKCKHIGKETELGYLSLHCGNQHCEILWCKQIHVNILHELKNACTCIQFLIDRRLFPLNIQQNLKTKCLTAKLKAWDKMTHWKDRRQEKADIENMEMVRDGKMDEMDI